MTDYPEVTHFVRSLRSEELFMVCHGAVKTVNSKRFVGVKIKQLEGEVITYDIKYAIDRPMRYIGRNPYGIKKWCFDYLMKHAVKKDKWKSSKEAVRSINKTIGSGLLSVIW